MFDSRNDFAAVFNDNCNTAKHLSVAAHLIINILSTLLLSASNYAMQVALSPSRADVDRAHRQQKWIDIRVLSFRNLVWISRYRLAAYGVLLLSSIPFHFLQVIAHFSSTNSIRSNSVLSTSVAVLVNGPMVLYVTPEYFTNPASANTSPPYIQGAMLNDPEEYDYNFWSNASEFPALAAKVRTNATLG